MACNLLYISPQFPPNFQHFIHCFRRLGGTVLGIASDGWGDLPPQLRSSLAEYYRVPNMADYSEVLKAARFFEGKYGSIQRIESHTEYWMPVEAALRDDLGACGPGKEDLPPIRRKSAMKEVFTKAGIPTALGMLCGTLEEAAAFALQTGYPLVAKPDEGVGAAGAMIVRDAVELADFFSRKLPMPYFLEEFIDGEICTFDGLADDEGRIVYCNSLEYSSGIMEVVNDDEEVYYWTARRICEDLEEAGRKTAAAFGVRGRFFHFEYFRRRSDGVLLGLEVNIRPPGGYTTDMWNYADDIDIYEQWGRIILEKRFLAKWERKHHVMYVDRKDRFHHRLSDNEVEHRFNKLICWRGRMPEIFSRALGNRAFILRSQSLEELRDAAQAIQARR